MIKNSKPAIHGEYSLDVNFPVRFEGDYRNGQLVIYSAYAQQAEDGVIIGELDMTEHPPVYVEFPKLPVPFAFPYQTDNPELRACWDDLGHCLHRFMQFALSEVKRQPDLTSQSFRVNGDKHIFDFDHIKHDPEKHRPYVLVIQPEPVPATEEMIDQDDIVPIEGLSLAKGLSAGIPRRQLPRPVRQQRLIAGQALPIAFVKEER